MLAEQLNSGSWLHRATACRMLCYLRGETSNVTAPVVIFEYFRILFPNTVKLANFYRKCAWNMSSVINSWASMPIDKFS